MVTIIYLKQTKIMFVLGKKYNWRFEKAQEMRNYGFRQLCLKTVLTFLYWVWHHTQ